MTNFPEPYRNVVFSFKDPVADSIRIVTGWYEVSLIIPDTGWFFFGDNQFGSDGNTMINRDDVDMWVYSGNSMEDDLALLKKCDMWINIFPFIDSRPEPGWAFDVYWDVSKKEIQSEYPYIHSRNLCFSSTSLIQTFKNPYIAWDEAIKYVKENLKQHREVNQHSREEKQCFG